ncbi:hypothetical protein BDN72DRAFT_208033 [Pluteus cervinus]|uniref:Uncharacterized protein n=1 Tax=Pluteus cervinus TaxID=181527 RepID=A0ACD3AHL6_9AGAR|nr:hypothetical protein BDN72DRAFT_208033 [Pluteus cervinus]
MADPKKYELGKVHVEVSMSSRYETLIDQTQICHLTKQGGGDGLGIKANFIHSRFDNTRIEVKVYIPVPGGEEMKLKNFETDLPYLRQVLYMAYPITFGSLKLRGEGQDIDAALIVADTVDIRTSDAIAGGVFETTGPISLFTKNGMISGRFNTSSAVSLVTYNAPIFAIVHLSNDENTCKDTELVMQTTNGAIDGTITLTSLADDGLGGLFDVFSVTSNAASHLMFTSISPRAKLDLASHTTAHNAMVELDRAYEGEITLETTSDSRADVHLWSLLNRHDPEHRGRKRAAIVTHDKSPGEVHGRVWWDEDGQDVGRGTVEVKTSYGKVELRM